MASERVFFSNSPLEIKEHICQRLYGNEIDVAAFIQHLSSREPAKVLK